MTQDTSSLLKKKELAKSLGVSVGTIDAWRRQGAPYIQRGHVIRFERDKVVAWLRRQSAEFTRD